MSFRSTNGTNRHRLRFDISDAPWRVPTTPSDAYTMMIWFKLDSGVTNEHIPFAYGHASTAVDIARFETDSGTLNAALYDGAGNLNSLAPAFVAGEWYHCTVILGYDGTPRMKLFTLSTSINDPGIVSEHLTISTDQGAGVLNQALYILGIPGINDHALAGIGAEFKFWPFAFQGGTEEFMGQIQQEARAKGPVYRPESCVYFPLDSKHRLNDGQGWGLRLTSEADTGDGPVFDAEHPPGLLPASFFQRQMMQHNPPPDATTVFPRRRVLYPGAGAGSGTLA